MPETENIARITPEMRLQKELDTAVGRVKELEIELKKRHSVLDDFGLTPEELADLPAALVEQLSIGPEEVQLMDIIAERGGTASLDQIMVLIYKRTREVRERRKVNLRLAEMARRGRLYSVETGKGIYSIYKPATTEET